MFPTGFGDVNAGNRGISGAPKGLIRYWAAAREAAGCSEERYVADTLSQALTAAIAAHGLGVGEGAREVLVRRRRDAGEPA
ncbi:MAG TPA: hypothetical protein VGL75_09020 [Acidothermaceae bacterium]